MPRAVSSRAPVLKPRLPSWERPPQRGPPGVLIVAGAGLWVSLAVRHRHRDIGSGPTLILVTSQPRLNTHQAAATTLRVRVSATGHSDPCSPFRLVWGHQALAQPWTVLQASCPSPQFPPFPGRASALQAGYTAQLLRGVNWELPWPQAGVRNSRLAQAGTESSPEPPHLLSSIFQQHLGPFRICSIFPHLRVCNACFL